MRMDIPGGGDPSSTREVKVNLGAAALSPTAGVSREPEPKNTGVLSTDRILYRLNQQTYGEFLGTSPNGMIAAFFREDKGAGDLISKRLPQQDLPGTHVAASLELPDTVPGLVTLYSLAEADSVSGPKALRSFLYSSRDGVGIKTLTPLSDGQRVLISKSNGYGRPVIHADELGAPMHFGVGRIAQEDGRELTIERRFNGHAPNPHVCLSANETEVFLHGTGHPSLLQALLKIASSDGGSLNMVERYSLLPGNSLGQVLSNAAAGTGPREPGHSKAMACAPDGSYALSGLIGGVEYFKLSDRRPSRGAFVGDIKLPADAAVKVMAFNPTGDRFALIYNRIGSTDSREYPLLIYSVDRSGAAPHFTKTHEIQGIYPSDYGRLSFFPGSENILMGGYINSMVTSIGHGTAETQLTLGSCEFGGAILNAEGNVVASRGDLVVFKA